MVRDLVHQHVAHRLAEPVGVAARLPLDGSAVERDPVRQREQVAARAPRPRHALVVAEPPGVAGRLVLDADGDVLDARGDLRREPVDGVLEGGGEEVGLGLHDRQGTESRRGQAPAAAGRLRPRC